MNSKAGLVMNWHWRRIHGNYLWSSIARHANWLHRAIAARAVSSAGPSPKE